MINWLWARSPDQREMTRFWYSPKSKGYVCKPSWTVHEWPPVSIDKATFRYILLHIKTHVDAQFYSKATFCFLKGPNQIYTSTLHVVYELRSEEEIQNTMRFITLHCNTDGFVHICMYDSEIPTDGRFIFGPMHLYHMRTCRYDDLGP